MLWSRKMCLMTDTWPLYSGIERKEIREARRKFSCYDFQFVIRMAHFPGSSEGWYEAIVSVGQASCP